MPYSTSTKDSHLVPYIWWQEVPTSGGHVVSPVEYVAVTRWVWDVLLRGKSAWSSAWRLLHGLPTWILRDSCRGTCGGSRPTRRLIQRLWILVSAKWRSCGVPGVTSHVFSMQRTTCSWACSGGVLGILITLRWGVRHLTVLGNTPFLVCFVLPPLCFYPGNPRISYFAIPAR